MKSKFIKPSGRIYAVVRKPESVAHLAPNSLTHAVHRQFAATLKQYSTGLISSDISPPSKLKFPSLEGGMTFSAQGDQVPESEFVNSLNEVRKLRGHYFRAEAARKGTYRRKRKVDPLRQLGISIFPSHALALSALDNAGVPARNVVQEIVRVVRDVFLEAMPYEIVGFAVHSEESVLHLHVSYSVVSETLRLLHEGDQRGQPAKNFLNIGRCGTLRLVEYGYWPESDAADVREKLHYLEQKFGAEPIDWRICQVVDGTLEVHFLTSDDQRVRLAYEVASDEYRRHAQAVREARPDVLLARNRELESELATLREKLARYEKDAPRIPSVETLLRDLTRACHKFIQNSGAPGSIPSGVEVVRDGKSVRLELSPQIDGRISEAISSCETDADGLIAEYDELRRTLAAASEFMQDRPPEPGKEVTK
jgi:hypothetical protein